MHISQKLAEAEKTGKPMFSFEFFPPKTAQVGRLLDVAQMGMCTYVRCRESKTFMIVCSLDHDITADKICLPDLLN